DTREVQPHDANEKEQLGLASVKAEPGSTGTTTTTTGTRLLHGILSQHPQQHGLGVQNGYGRHLAGHAQMGQPSYTTATIATTSTPGCLKLFLPTQTSTNSPHKRQTTSPHYTNHSKCRKKEI
ncbi:hypothetical protein E2986_11951, partial [Frieseomelitta varia]